MVNTLYLISLAVKISRMMRRFISVITLLAVLLPALSGAQDKVKEIDSVIKHWQGLMKFNGSVLVAQHGEIILHKGYGIRAVDRGDIVAETTLYMVGGLTEMFTASIIFKLQEEGKLSIEDKLGKYIPGFPNADNIQLKHLLSHQSGIFDYMNSDTLYDLSIASAKDSATMLSIITSQPQQFEAGTAFQYSTSNFYLLGKVIEQAADTNYYDAARKYVLNPLNIENSGFAFGMFASWDKAQGYNILNNQRYIPSFPPDSTISYAAAGLFTSTTGIYKFVNAMLHNKLLKKSSWGAMTTEHGNGYGYGWIVDTLFDKIKVGHTGESYGFVSSVDVIKEDSTIIVILSNDYESEIFRMRDDIASILYNKPYKLPRKREHVFLDRMKIEQYAGRYEFEHGKDMTLYYKDKLLWGKIQGQKEFTLLADLEPDTFFMSSVDVEVYFKRQKKTNLVTEMIIRQNRKETVGHKVMRDQ